MSDLINMSSQFQGLPMADLIGAPLTAACDSQLKLASATATFIETIGFESPDADGNLKPRTAKFQFNRPVNKDDGNGNTQIVNELVELEVPMLAIVNIPNLAIQKVDINFEMEVKSSFSQVEKSASEGKFAAEAKVGWGVFSAKVSVQGSVSSSKENTRKSDNSAKYSVSVLAEDKGMPEGLARVLDIMQSAVAPTSVSAAA
jgi:hypothetical protein